MGVLLAEIISRLISILSLLIIIRALFSWFRPSGYNKFYYDVERFLHTVTEPILAPIRNVLPPVGPGIDLSPLVAILLLNVLNEVVFRVLRGIF